VSTFNVNNNLFWNLTVRLLAYLRSPEIAAYDGLPELRTLPPEPREKAKKRKWKKTDTGGRVVTSGGRGQQERAGLFKGQFRTAQSSDPMAT